MVPTVPIPPSSGRAIVALPTHLPEKYVHHQGEMWTLLLQGKAQHLQIPCSISVRQKAKDTHTQPVHSAK